MWVGSRAACVHILSYTQVRISILNPPRSQALKKLTCFGSLDAPLNCLGYGIPTWYSMESSLRNTPMGALDNDYGRQGREQDLSSTLWLEETRRSSPISTTCQERTLPSTSCSSMTGRQAPVSREKIPFKKTPQKGT